MAVTIFRVRPTPTDAYLGNPHKGCCTFQHFNGDPLFPGTSWSEEGPTEFPPPEADVIEGYLPTTIAYCRWFWRLLEPQDGNIDFSVIDKSLETCAKRGQTLAVRLMAHGSARQPQVPDWYAAKYPMADVAHKANSMRVPLYDAPEYLQRWGGLVREFAARYDDHPLLESIDITYIGPWGEGAGECSAEQCRRFAELWAEAFTNTPRLALIAGDQMREAVATGSGWRCDCFGDLRAVGSAHVAKHRSWNHMYDAYPPQVAVSAAADAWKTAPVHFETCSVPMTWYQRGYDIDFICRQGLKYHGTYFMPKSTALPAEWAGKLADFCRQLGYRYVFRQANLITGERPGGLRFQAWIENVGVAPIYRRYDFVLRLRQAGREARIPFEKVDIRTWLPGDVWLDEWIDLPEGFEGGYVEVSAGLVGPRTKKAAVGFANKEQFSDRWLSLEGTVVP